MTFDIATILILAALVVAAGFAIRAGLRGANLAQGPQAARRRGPLRGEPRSKAGRWLVAGLSILLILGVLGALALALGLFAAAP